MKTIALSTLGIILGVVAGAVGMHQWLMPQIIDLDNQLRDRDHKLAAIRPDDGAAARLARLESERANYEQTLGLLREQLDALQRASTVEPSEPALPEDLSVIDGALEETPERDSGEGSRDGENREGRRGGPPWDRDSTPEEREARRQEFAAQMQDNLTSFFTGELDKSSTPEMKERLVTLETQVYDMMELRRQMRDVEDEAEREALRQAFSDTMAAAEATMKDQQRDMIDAIAAQFDITSSADKQAFQSAVRAAVKSPFFNDNPSSIFWSAGRGDGGRGEGGPGGGPGRGGFRR